MLHEREDLLKVKAELDGANKELSLQVGRPLRTVSTKSTRRPPLAAVAASSSC